MNKQELVSEFNREIYFFILKKVKEENVAKDIFQNVYLKACEHLYQIREKKKVRAWLFQITRNEIANYYSRRPVTIKDFQEKHLISEEDKDRWGMDKLCCFDNFMNELPPIYKTVVDLVYKEGKRQKEVAQILDISLPNVKARIRRAQAILKKRFRDCCHYEQNNNGKLIGEPNCTRCNTVL